MAFLIGILLASAIAALARVSGFDRDRAFYPTVLIVVASYYDLFGAMGGFFTAPFYKGTGPSLESPVTATDALVLFGFMLLLPRVLEGKLKLPTLVVSPATYERIQALGPPDDAQRARLERIIAGPPSVDRPTT